MSINGQEIDAKTTLYYEFRITSMKYKPPVLQIQLLTTKGTKNKLGNAYFLQNSKRKVKPTLSK
jgi:hypothetical protein